MTILDDWADYMQACGASHSTVLLHVRTMTALVNYAETKPEDLDRSHVVRFLGRPLSAWSRLTYWKAIKKYSEYRTEFGAPTDLVRGIPRPRTPDPTPRPVTDETVTRLLAAQLSPRAAAYVRLALFEGLRVHEVAQIRGEHFDHSAGWLMVTGKGGRTAPIPIHPEISKLAEMMAEFGYWFPSPTGGDRCVSAISVSQTITSALRFGRIKRDRAPTARHRSHPDAASC